MELSITLTPRPAKKELIVALQMGALGRLLVAQVSNLPSAKPVTLTGSGPGFVRDVEAALQAFVPQPHFVYQVLSIARKASKEPPKAEKEGDAYVQAHVGRR